MSGRFLLDTSTFLWLSLSPANLSDYATEIISDAGNELYLSSASAWEISIKYSIGKLILEESPTVFVPKYREAHIIKSLTITEEAVLLNQTLPFIHNDPFDRILICQSVKHGMPIITNDPHISRYPVNFLW